ncbi:MAG TPA: RidA family protein [Chloroflexi bacterium]|nr:MAG: reactive intermediate/imine deaminase [Anaerolineaceae bacterium 4572_5.1]HEY85136.1 RidA family protein [Chloroflexota bacterium]
MKRKIIHTDKAPVAVGPYSQAVKSKRMIFTAGQIPLDPSTGKLVEGGIEEQTRQALTNLKVVLKAAGSGMDAVMKTTVFLLDMGEFAAMNGVYAEFFPQDPPARSAVQVVALPLGARVEIEAIALVK